jgi:hypothetical protein
MREADIEENEGIPSWNVVDLVNRAAFAPDVYPRLCTNIHCFAPRPSLRTRASAGSREIKPVVNLDCIVDVIVRPPFVGVLDHAETVIDDFHTVGGQISNNAYKGRTHDQDADRPRSSSTNRKIASLSSAWTVPDVRAGKSLCRT